MPCQACLFMLNIIWLTKHICITCVVYIPMVMHVFHFMLCFLWIDTGIFYPHLSGLLHWHPWYKGSWGLHGTHLGPVGPRWIPCRPNEPCYLGQEQLYDHILHPKDDACILCIVVLCCGLAHFFSKSFWFNRSNFSDMEAITWVPWCKCSNPEEYG